MVPTQSPTKLFRLKEGFRHSFGGVELQPGEEIHLTEQAAKAFRDRFEPVDPKAKFAVVSHEELAKVHSAKETSDAPHEDTPSSEAMQAQADKASAESVAAGKTPAPATLPAAAHRGPTKTEDATKGTVTADPDGSAKKL